MPNADTQYVEVVLFFFFFACHMACRTLIPQPETEPVFPAVEAWSPHHWTAKEFPQRICRFRFFLSCHEI